MYGNDYEEHISLPPLWLLEDTQCFEIKKIPFTTFAPRAKSSTTPLRQGLRSKQRGELPDLRLLDGSHVCFCPILLISQSFPSLIIMFLSFILQNSYRPMCARVPSYWGFSIVFERGLTSESEAVLKSKILHWKSLHKFINQIDEEEKMLIFSFKNLWCVSKNEQTVSALQKPFVGKNITCVGDIIWRNTFVCIWT